MVSRKEKRRHLSSQSSSVYSSEIMSSHKMTSRTDDVEDECNNPEKDDSILTPDLEMKRGLFKASRVPAKLRDIRSFQTLHSPRIHGMTEWLLQYENAHKRQNEYLQQLQHLRQQFRGGNEIQSTGITKNHDSFRKRHQRGKDYWLPHQSPYYSKSSEGRIPNPVCVLHPKSQSIQRVMRRPTHGDVPPPPQTTGFLMAPRSFMNGVEALPVGQTLRGEAHVRLPPIGDLDRHQTDYEPIEHIAERNKLNLNKYLKSNSSGKTWAQVSPRNTVDVSDVFIQATKVP